MAIRLLFALILLLPRTPLFFIFLCKEFEKVVVLFLPLWSHQLLAHSLLVGYLCPSSGEYSRNINHCSWASTKKTERHMVYYWTIKSSPRFFVGDCPFLPLFFPSFFPPVSKKRNSRYRFSFSCRHHSYSTCSLLVGTLNRNLTSIYLLSIVC